MKINFKQEARYIGTAAMFGVMCYVVSLLIVFGLGKLGWWISDLDKLPWPGEETVNHAVFLTSFLTAYVAVRISESKERKT
jgi:hypothetical protein